MSISPIVSVTDKAATAVQTTEQLSQDFMTLLVAQLQAQDPLEPMDSTAFMAQLVQLQTLTETTQMNDSLSQLTGLQSQATGLALVGRTVQWRDADTGERLSATVTGVELTAGDCRLDVGGTQIGLDEVLSAS